jgi:hypothetical protein
VEKVTSLKRPIFLANGCQVPSGTSIGASASAEGSFRAAAAEDPHPEAAFDGGRVDLSTASRPRDEGGGGDEIASALSGLAMTEEKRYHFPIPTVSPQVSPSSSDVEPAPPPLRAAGPCSRLFPPAAASSAAPTPCPVHR